MRFVFFTVTEHNCVYVVPIAYILRDLLWCWPAYDQRQRNISLIFVHFCASEQGTRIVK